MHFSPYVLPSLVSAMVMLILFLYVFLFRRKSTGSWQFLFIMLSCIFWAFGYAMSIILVDDGQKIFWYNLAQVGPDFSPVFWFLLILEHTGHENYLRKKWIGFVFALPIVTTIFMWTNDWHHLLRKAVEVKAINESVFYVTTQRGPWYIVESIYAYILIAISFYLLVGFVKWSSSRRQTLILIVGFILPIVSNLLDLFNLNPLKPYGATSIYFTVTGIILAWGLFYERLLDITPIARNKVLENIGDGVIVLDRDKRVVDINPAAVQLFSNTDGPYHDLVSMKIDELIPDWPEWNFQEQANADKKKQIGVTIKQEYRVFSVTLSNLFDQTDRLMGWVAIFHDISEEIDTNIRLQEQLDEINKLQDQLREQALRDPLTNCFNRRYLEETLTRESSRADRDDQTIGLVMIDIDHFKQVNDLFGHKMGDQVLHAIGLLMQKKVRLGDIVCRYGGEEFLIVFPGISMSMLTERVRTLCSQISSLEIKTSSGELISVTVSAGIALYPQHDEDIEVVLTHADEALYIAKRAGRNTVYVWNLLDDAMKKPNMPS